MNSRIPATFRLAATRLVGQRSSAAEAPAELEQQMATLELCSADKRFLRTVHEAEKQLNDAFDEAHRPGDLQQQVSHVYKQLYRPD